MPYYIVSEEDLKDIADAIRTKGETSDLLQFPDDFVEAVGNIQTGITPTGTKQINVSSNGTTTQDVTEYASAEIIANVPNSYSQGDEGKVVYNGALASQSSMNINSDGTYDTTMKNQVVVNTGGGGGGGGTELYSPDFYVYELVNGEYVDRTDSRVTFDDAKTLLGFAYSPYPGNLKSIRNENISYPSAMKLAGFINTTMGGANSNLISTGNKVNAYEFLHLGFSGKSALNSSSDGALYDLPPTSFTAAAVNPNRTSIYNGYAVNQITLTLNNPESSDWVINSVYFSAPAAQTYATEAQTPPTGSEHCV